METLQITGEEFLQAQRWLNGEASTLGEREVLSMLRSLNDAFRANCKGLRPGPVPRFPRLGSLPEGYLKLIGAIPDGDCEEPSAPATPEEAVMREVKECSALDSVQLLNSIAYVGSVAGYPPTQSRAQIILYCFYGARLGAGKGRLAIEHPQMWRYGPVFPRAFKCSRLEDRAACEADYNALMERDTELMAALSAKTQAMMATPMADLNAVHKGEGSPYGRTLKLNPEKWGIRIPDEEIAEFFRTRNTV